MIALRGVVAGLGASPVLRGVDLDVPAGECCAVVGPNGGGRTTLLRVCAALLRPRAGSVVVAGFDAVRRPRAVRARVGYVPQRAGGVEGQTVREELDLAAALHSIAPGRRRSIAADLLELVGLDAVADADAAHISPGQYRRLLLARALVHDPAVLLLDTPDAGLDDEGVAELAGVLGELRGMGKAILVSGSAELLARCCNGELRLDRGVASRPRRPAPGLSQGVPA